MSGQHAHHHHHHDHRRGTLTQRAAIASVSMALFLLILKSWAAIETGSVAMLGSLADTTLDIIASLVTLFSVRLAARPADHEYRYGHGKAEALAALFQAGIITASAIAIAIRGITRIGETTAPSHPALGIGVSLIAMATTAMLITYQRYVVGKTGSVAIHADHVHYSSDLLLNASVIVALALDSLLHVRGADPVFGVGIALWLIWHVREILGNSIHQLMDREWPEEKREQFLAVARTHPALNNIHDLRTRSSGARDFAQIHVWVDPQTTIAEAHKAMDELEEKLAHEFPGVEIMIHPEPEGHTEGHQHEHELPDEQP
jgi:ferrous-iron efflux pump FieF